VIHLDKVPYIGFGNEELDQCPDLKKGDILQCKKCSLDCEVHLGKDKETGEESETLMFIHCDNCDQSYLVGVNGKCVQFWDSATKGNIETYPMPEAGLVPEHSVWSGEPNPDALPQEDCDRETGCGGIDCPSCDDIADADPYYTTQQNSITKDKEGVWFVPSGKYDSPEEMWYNSVKVEDIITQEEFIRRMTEHDEFMLEVIDQMNKFGRLMKKHELPNLGLNKLHNNLKKKDLEGKDVDSKGDPSETS
jgi:hypothetical protein